MVGKTLYSPITVALKCGANPRQDPSGTWEMYTYRLIAIYQADWQRVGGFTKPSLKGTEYWDLLDRVVAEGMEIERLRTSVVYRHNLVVEKMRPVDYPRTF